MGKTSYSKSETTREKESLAAFSEKRIVRLLDSDDGLVAMLLQKVHPGKELSTVDDDEEATRIAAELIRDIPTSVPENHNFPTITEWLEVIDRIGTNHPLPTEMLQKARILHAELDAAKEQTKLLHGDLHHHNILWDEEDGWTAIDPQSVIGDPVYEAARMLHNPDNFFKSDDYAKKTERRIKILSKVLNCDSRRIRGWGYVDSIISACWTIEDNGEGWEDAIKCARILDSSR